MPLALAIVQSGQLHTVLRPYRTHAIGTALIA